MTAPFDIIRKIARDAFRIDNVEYEPADVLTVAHDNDRSYVYDGRHYSPLIDTLEDDLRKKRLKCLSVARIISVIKGDLAYGDVRSPEGAFARALIQKRLKALLFPAHYPYSFKEERIWARVLDETGARSVIAIQPSRELCKACHERGIWVADMQHGVIADTHPWYGKSFRSKDPVNQLPSAFLCWDEGSADVIRSWARDAIDVQVIGNRWLNRFLHPQKDDTLVSSVLRESLTDVNGSDDRPKILVSLSWGDKDIPNGFIADALEAAIRSTSDDYRWLIRLHPNQLVGFATHEGPLFQTYYNERLKGHAEWQWVTSAPLPFVLGQVDAHISWWSSVSIEASLAGLKTALLSPRLREGESHADYYGYFRSIGSIDLVQAKPDEIRAWLKENLSRPRNPRIIAAADEAYGALLAAIAERSLAGGGHAGQKP
jgi:hypothetical protein